LFSYDVVWATVHRILVAAALEVVGLAAPTSMIGIDETRARSVRWFREEAKWRRSDPWMTSIVDLDPAHAAGIIGLGTTAATPSSGPNPQESRPSKDI
jgi:transposase